MFIALTIIFLLFGSFTLGSVLIGAICGYLDKTGGGNGFGLIILFLIYFLTGEVNFFSALFGYLSVIEK